jgi:hypothetical protein
MTSSDPPGRRAVLTGMTGAGLGAVTAGGKAMAAGDAIAPIQFEFIYEAHVLVGPMQNLGPHRLGTQRLIPILGGSFKGPDIEGEVLPGCADWNLLRNDGATQVEAAYFMRTHDGVTFKITNTGVNPATPVPGRPRFTHPVFDVPIGPYDWLNKHTFVGTLIPGQGFVTIGVYKLV